MKKLFLLMTSIFMLAMIAACDVTTSNTTQTTLAATETTVPATTNQTTTLAETTLGTLDVPTNILITENIITFSSVDQASKYKATIYDADAQLVGQYNISSSFDLSLLLSVGSYTLTLKATAPGFNDSESSPVVTFDIVDESRVSQIEGTDMNDFNLVRWLGRTDYKEATQEKYFFFTASGFEVAFYGTELTATFTASNYNVDGKQPYIVAFVDGEENPNNGVTFVLNQAEQTITLVSGLTDGYHTLKLLKRSEASDSNAALKDLHTDGYFTTPPLAKNFRIEYIAASSSTGFGNLGSVSVAKSTANSDGLRAYAFLTSYLLDADTSIFSASGWGVSRGWNTGGAISEVQNIPYAYTKTAIDDTNHVYDNGEALDYSDYVPDVLVVNLGTNDFNASSYNAMTDLEKPVMEERFKTDYVTFLVLLNNLYPNAKIIVAYGLMGEAGTLGDITLNVIDQANTTIGHTVVYPFLMEAAGTNGNPYGSAWHPNVQTGMNVATELANLISTLTGREVLRDMIAYE